MAKAPVNPFGKPGKAVVEDDDFSVDMTDVTSGFQIEADDYPAKLMNITKETSKAGNPMFVWSFVIIGTKNAGKEFKQWTALTDAAMFKVAETLVAFGLPGAGAVANFKKSDVVGKRVMIRIEDSTYNDQESSSLAKVLPHPDGPVITGPIGKPGAAAKPGK